MERKEPVMAQSVLPLEERIPLTWREVNELASVKSAEEKPEPASEAPVDKPLAHGRRDRRSLRPPHARSREKHPRCTLANARNDASQRAHAGSLRSRPIDSAHGSSGPRARTARRNSLARPHAQRRGSSVTSTFFSCENTKTHGTPTCSRGVPFSFPNITYSIFRS